MSELGTILERVHRAAAYFHHREGVVLTTFNLSAAVLEEQALPAVLGVEAKTVAARRAELHQRLGATPCTVFYEYSYPTYRPIFSDMVSRTARGERITYSAMGGELAQLLADDPLLKQQIEAKKDFNLFVVAHSQGGVMARAGLQPFYGRSGWPRLHWQQ